MKKLFFFVLVLSALSSARLSAQSLVGTWVSREPVLVSLRFSLTFYQNDYLINYSLGQTFGLYQATTDKIHFTPTKVGINGGNIGKTEIWDYKFIDKDSFSLSSDAIKIKLVRSPPAK